jgi:hypothetical protein
MIEGFNGAKQTEIALLDEIQEREAPVCILLRDGYHQAEVR